MSRRGSSDGNGDGCGEAHGRWGCWRREGVGDGAAAGFNPEIRVESSWLVGQARLGGCAMGSEERRCAAGWQGAGAGL